MVIDPPLTSSDGSKGRSAICFVFDAYVEVRALCGATVLTVLLNQRKLTATSKVEILTQLLICPPASASIDLKKIGVPRGRRM